MHQFLQFLDVSDECFEEKLYVKKITDGFQE